MAPEAKSIALHGKLFQPYLSAEVIAERVAEMGQQIALDYAGAEPVMVVVLKGSAIFAADLSRAMQLPLEMEFVRLSSYSGTQSTGVVKALLPLADELCQGRHLLVVEDIVDTGTTLSKFLPDLKARGAASVKLAALLSKPDARKHEVPIDYLGFEIPNDFVVGYGLDYDELGRNIPGIWSAV
jgi:hypoxanthine phosphoribosyltransferase